MGADRKIITVTGLNLSALRATELDKLCEALSEIPDYPYNLVILSAAADTLDAGNLPKKPSELLTTLSEYLRPVYFERNTPAKLAGWVQKHYLHGGVQADPNVCRFTVEYCGRNMFTLAGEIEKVAFYVRAKGRDTATEADVRTAAIPAMEYDAFAFTNAITDRRRADALDILADLKLRRVEPLYILSEVSRVVCDLMAIRTMSDGGQTATEISTALKMHEYRVGIYLKQARKTDSALLRNAVIAAEAADRALKRSAADGYGIIERLICSL
jgi:DNA polymerase-3 subunit delta